MTDAELRELVNHANRLLGGRYNDAFGEAPWAKQWVESARELAVIIQKMRGSYK